MSTPEVPGDAVAPDAVAPAEAPVAAPEPVVVPDTSVAAQTTPPDDYALAAQQTHVDRVLVALDDLIERVGQDISAGIQHENQAVRVGASNLKNVLDSLQGSRAVVAAYTPGGNSGPTVNVGPNA